MFALITCQSHNADVRDRTLELFGLLESFLMAPGTGASWVAIHGNAIVSDHSHPVSIEHTTMGAVVKPKVNLTGTFHAAIPSAPNGSTKIKTLQILEDEELATVSRIQIHYGKNRVYSQEITARGLNIENLHISAHFFPPRVQEGEIGHGFSVTATVLFEQTDSKITVWSLGVLFCDA